MNTSICEAVEGRRLVRFSYDGGNRTVEPYCHGTSATGKEVLRAYQISGASKSGKTEGWKLFEVAKMSYLQLLPQSFSTNRPGYNPNDSGMIRIHCNVLREVEPSTNTSVTDKLEAGIALCKVGDKRQAQAILQQVIQVEPHNESAWFWYIDTLPNDLERLKSLEEYLGINPNSAVAREAVVLLRNKISIENSAINLSDLETVGNQLKTTPVQSGVTLNPFPLKAVPHMPSYRRATRTICENCGERFYEGDGVTCDNCYIEYCDNCGSDFTTCSSCDKVFCPNCESELEENELGGSVCSECAEEGNLDQFDYNEWDNDNDGSLNDDEDDSW